MADDDALVAQVVAEGVRNFVVEEGEEAVAGIDQVHLDIEIGENGGIFTADDAGPIDGDGARGVAEAQYRITVENAWMVEDNIRGMVGTGAGGDDEVFRAEDLRHAFRPRHLNMVVIDEAGLTKDDIHPVAVIVAVTGADLGLDDVVRGPDQVGELHFHLVEGVLKQGVAPVVGQHLDGVTQGLAGDGAPVGAATPHLIVGLDHGDFLARLAKLHGGTLARRSGSDDDGVEGSWLHLYTSPLA